ncbi:MAG: hypothetical protein M1829_003745 [Trizodia sp. TS-e1964]|nr:MAG: hypothetical protein M1829_003745 [Trizodia sp. TS-e1964]
MFTSLTLIFPILIAGTGWITPALALPYSSQNTPPVHVRMSLRGPSIVSPFALAGSDRRCSGPLKLFKNDNPSEAFGCIAAFSGQVIPLTNGAPKNPEEECDIFEIGYLPQSPEFVISYTPTALDIAQLLSASIRYCTILKDHLLICSFEQIITQPRGLKLEMIEKSPFTSQKGLAKVLLQIAAFNSVPALSSWDIFRLETEVQFAKAAANGPYHLACVQT